MLDAMTEGETETRETNKPCIYIVFPEQGWYLLSSFSGPCILQLGLFTERWEDMVLQRRSRLGVLAQRGSKVRGQNF